MSVNTHHHPNALFRFFPFLRACLFVSLTIGLPFSQKVFGEPVLYDATWEAEVLALEMSGELLPPTELTNQIYEDLEAIREAYPSMSLINLFPKWRPGELLIDLTDDAADDFSQGQYDALDPLFEVYGVPKITKSYSGDSIKLVFGQNYNPELLAQLFVGVDGTNYAQPNFLYGDGNDVQATGPSTYTFTNGWGDCLSGCIHEESWVFEVSEDQVVNVIGSPPPESMYVPNRGILLEYVDEAGNKMIVNPPLSFELPNLSPVVPEPSVSILSSIGLLFLITFNRCRKVTTTRHLRKQ